VIVTPMMRGFICANAHPAGCARTVDEAIAQAQRQPFTASTSQSAPGPAPARVLVIGASGGLGFAVRTAAAFGGGARTVGVALERPGTPARTATAGWYRSARFHERADELGLPAWTLMGDAFGDEVKRATVELIRAELGAVDLVVYSVAAPRRTDPVSGVNYRSFIKTIGAPFSAKGYDVGADQVRPMTLEPAAPDEIAQTVAVMGGDDWSRWLDALLAAGVLADGARSLAFSYVGTPLLAPTYRAGTLGAAKDDLEATALRWDARLREACGGGARVAVMKALVTQASVVIPMSMLYTMLLYHVLAERGLDEGPLEQAQRLLGEALSGAALRGAAPPLLDERGRWRLDDRELRPDVQAEIARRWDAVNSDNLAELGDKGRVLADVMKLYGFGVEGVAYDAEVDPVWPIPQVREIATVTATGARA
jgi:enoyl-[acyl-carrier protein] reductase / trans-2-enoyl-CoA reductase (NAD+)